jgi:hypothetical protein
MGKRKVTILEPAATSVAEVAWFIESLGLKETAVKFVNETFDFFEKISDDRVEHKPCSYEKWKLLLYRCVPYLSLQKEIVICDFVPAKLLK